MGLVVNKFYYKKDLSPEDLISTIEVSESVVFVPGQTKFGPTVPNFEEFLSFLGVKVFTQGFSNFNNLGLDTQVPARINYLVEKPINVTYPYWVKINRVEVLSDQDLFSNFSRVEYSFLDCLINFDRIGDGYFRTKEDLIKGIFSRMDEVEKSGFKIDRKKIIDKALVDCPQLIKFKQFFK